MVFFASYKIGKHMHRFSTLLCGALLHLSVNAADVVPAHLTGTWGTGASLHDGKDEQTELYLLPDGYGAIAGSTPPMPRKDGADDGKPAPRVIMGFPLHARMDGDTLMLRPFLPKGVPGMKGEIIIPCHYEQAERTLSCTTPDKPKTFVMKRRDETIPADVEKMLAQVVQMEKQ
jgi:hypothetical protein